MATKFNMPDEFIHGVSNPGKACADPTLEAINTGSSSRHLGAM